MRYRCYYKSKTGSRYYTVWDEDGCGIRVRVSAHPARYKSYSGKRRIDFNLEEDKLPKNKGMVREFKRLLRMVHVRRAAKKGGDANG